MSVSEIAQVLPEAVRRASLPGAVVYTARQLYYEVCRGLRPVALADAPPGTVEAEVAFEDFATALAGWEGAAPVGLLAPEMAQPLPRAGREPDLTHYGLGKLLICRDPEIARMLRANLFHMEVGCAVIALPEPALVPPPFAGMLELARRASVFALHDASVGGMRWAQRLRRVAAFADGVRYRPIGLRPVHARRLHLTAHRGEPPPAHKMPPALAPEELAWLAAGWTAEVAAVHPARLLRALRRIVLGNLPTPTPELAQPASGYMTWP